MKALFDSDTLKAVQKDYDYLQKMKEMDMKILSKGDTGEGEGEKGEERKGLEMTDVVPVGGLIMARFLFFGNFMCKILKNNTSFFVDFTWKKLNT